MPHQNSYKFGCLVRNDVTDARSIDERLSQVSRVQSMPIFPASAEQQPTSMQTVFGGQPIIFAQFDAIARNRPVAHEFPCFTAALRE